jgi:hypothetical protein
MRRGQFNFLDLPVYRIDEDAYYEARADFADRLMTEHPLPTTPHKPSAAVKLSPQDARMQEHLYRSFGGSWRYNEIVGYLRLHFLGSQVRAEYWRVEVKRIVRTRRKQIEFRDWKLAPETELPMEGSSEEIFRAVLEHVEDCRKELGKLHLDSSALDTLGPYINWRGLLHGP